jgi:hypothetical protein
LELAHTFPPDRINVDATRIPVIASRFMLHSFAAGPTSAMVYVV